MPSEGTKIHTKHPKCRQRMTDHDVIAAKHTRRSEGVRFRMPEGCRDGSIAMLQASMYDLVQQLAVCTLFASANSPRIPLVNIQRACRQDFGQERGTPVGDSRRRSIRRETKQRTSDSPCASLTDKCAPPIICRPTCVVFNIQVRQAFPYESITANTPRNSVFDMHDTG